MVGHRIDNAFIVNKLLVKDIFTSDSPLFLSNNGRVNITKKKAMHDRIEVWFNQAAIANALSYSLLADKHRIASDSAHYPSIYMHAPKKGWIEFKKLECGSFAHDASKPVLNVKPFY